MVYKTEKVRTRVRKDAHCTFCLLTFQILHQPPDLHEANIKDLRELYDFWYNKGYNIDYGLVHQKIVRQSAFDVYQHPTHYS